jgi:hypothetical protein
MSTPPFFSLAFGSISAMTHFCQGPPALLFLVTSISAASAVAGAQAPTAVKATPAPVVEVTAWKPRPFAEVVLNDPDLASCFVRTPGWWARSSEPIELPQASEVARHLAGDLADILAGDAPKTITITVANAPNVQPAAVVHGDAVLALLPTTPRTTATQLSQVVAAAVLASQLRPAIPEEDVSEALFLFAESLANAGSLSLASLPAELRPVRDWLEAKEASSAIGKVAQESFNTESSWEMRRARIVRLGQEGGAPPAVAHAAAYVVEAFGDAAVARRRPLELLRAWQQDKDKKFPAMPQSLKHALAEPGTIGMPKKPTDAEINNRSLRVFQNDLANGRVPAEAPAAPLPLSDRLLASALERAQGVGNACRWINEQVPAELRTGCRAEGEKPGVVYARPLAVGSDIVARTPEGLEGTLLRWPRWLLFGWSRTAPACLSTSWGSGPGAGRRLRRLVAPGDFRRLIVSPAAGAPAARWPWATIADRSAASHGSANSWAVSWVENDVLLASDGEAPWCRRRRGRPVARDAAVHPGAVLRRWHLRHGHAAVRGRHRPSVPGRRLGLQTRQRDRRSVRSGGGAGRQHRVRRTGRRVAVCRRRAARADRRRIHAGSRLTVQTGGSGVRPGAAAGMGSAACARAD